MQYSFKDTQFMESECSSIICKIYVQTMKISIVVFARKKDANKLFRPNGSKGDNFPQEYSYASFESERGFYYR
jgi:hypothetical protein